MKAPYIMAGDGGLETLLPTIEFLQQNGATMLEIGIPFSDPVADGPVIQAAGLRALASGVTLAGVLAELEQHKNRITIPLVIMCYANPITRFGIERFAQACATIGIKGVIIPDVPMEEETPFVQALRPLGIAFIRFITLTSTTERIKETLADAEGFIYAVTVKGTRGERASYEQDIFKLLQQVSAQSPVPVYAGFGISTKEHIANFLAVCDGVIIGSTIVQALYEKRYDDIIALLK